MGGGLSGLGARELRWEGGVGFRKGPGLGIWVCGPSGLTCRLHLGGPNPGIRPSFCSLSLQGQQPPLLEPQRGALGRSVENPRLEPRARLPRPSGEHSGHRTRLSPGQPLTVAPPAQAGGVQGPVPEAPAQSVAMEK